MLRWHLLRWRGWQLALHKICRSDDDRALHDHVGDNISVILKGRYTEIPGVCGNGDVHKAPSLIFRKAEKPHRLVLTPGEVAWTLWFRWPPRRQWGFHCPNGWRHWKDYVAFVDTDGGYGSTSQIGRGCDD
jgi:hypothetical protein